MALPISNVAYIISYTYRFSHIIVCMVTRIVNTKCISRRNGGGARNLYQIVKRIGTEVSDHNNTHDHAEWFSKMLRSMQVTLLTG